MNDEEKSLIHMLANNTGALAVRTEKLFDELQATRRELSELNGTMDAARHEQRHELRQVNERLAVLVDNVKDAEAAADEASLAVREHTGSHPREELDVGDTDKTVGKVVRHMLPIVGRVFPWVATALLGLWHLVERLIKHAW